ncbi:Thymidylate kinase [Candidatus Rubidus massiliensis]|nr:MAG: dTMP kinase [Chlamydia sp. 32-24]CDZ81764.1 Thymidylate kinase [Candidatus Rubidus massiliensis]
MSGIFITFEGGEGAGKSTLIKKIKEYLALKQLLVVHTREPGGSALSETVRNWILTKNEDLLIGSMAELLLFLAARSQHLEELIIPALSQDKIVLCDRFNDSTVVYQGMARGLGKEKVEHLCNLICQGIEPNLTLYLDVDPSIGLQRTKSLAKENAKEGDLDRIEQEGFSFHQKVRDGFLQLAKEKPDRIHVINANQTLQEVYESACHAIDEKLAL